MGRQRFTAEQMITKLREIYALMGRGRAWQGQRLMVKVTRKRYLGKFKCRVALETIRSEQTLSELAWKLGVHQTMIAQ